MAVRGEEVDWAADIHTKPFSRKARHREERSAKPKASQHLRSAANCIAVNACYLQLINLVFGATLELSNQGSSEIPKCEKRIKTYARNTTGQTRLSALTSAVIEKVLLLELKCTQITCTKE